MVQEKKALDSYLHKHLTKASKSQKLLCENSGYTELLSSVFKSDNNDYDSWANEPYPKNPSHLDHLIHKATNEKMVRSKSEVIIDLVLYQNKIPFRYECGLALPTGTVYPDFTIIHPETGEMFLWEHFGLMDVPNYSKDAFTKLSNYASAGYIPGINLITTYETKNNPLSVELVENIVDYYFL